MTPEDRKHIEAIRHALNKALGQARVAVDDAPHWAKDVVWLLDLVERQDDKIARLEWQLDVAVMVGNALAEVSAGAPLLTLDELKQQYGQDVLHHIDGCRYEDGWHCVATCPVKLAQGALPL